MTELHKYYNKNKKKLIFPSHFNEKIISFPKELKYLTFGNDFNQQVGDNLPNSVTHLIFGACFNQPIDNFPQNLTHLTFDLRFDQPINNLPSSITHLIFGACFNQKIDNLPGNLIYLKFGQSFSKIVTNLPTSLEIISVCNNEQKKLIKRVPFGCIINKRNLNF